MKKVILAVSLCFALAGCNTSYYFYNGRYYQKRFDGEMYLLGPKGEWTHLNQGSGGGQIGFNAQGFTQKAYPIDAKTAEKEAAKRLCAATVAACARNAIGLATEAGSDAPH